MARPKTAERLLCEDYVKEYYPKLKILTLAKKIYDENGKKYARLKSAEHIRRTYINEILGHNGERNRVNSDPSFFAPLTNDTTNQKPVQIQTGAKVLLMDIETAPVRAFVWGLWKQNIGMDFIQNDWFILTWAAKWLFEDKVYSGKLTGKEAIAQDDKRIMKCMWELLNQADIVITHNGEKFDVPKLNTRFITNGFAPPLPYSQIDIYKQAKRQFAYTSNKQDFISKVLGTPRKLETGGAKLWVDCYAGDTTALAKMLEYNTGDVIGLEANYLRMRAWIKPHPNMALFILDEHQHICPTCGSNDMKEQGKLYRTSAGNYELMRCGSCGSSGRKRVSETNVKQKRHLLMPTAR
jgi:hypothetical protein